ncbi:MAG TPA: thioredoxin family protein [Rudaea sp.]|jgi:thiol-disulfide isomerase/thioredoxin|uniref:thioredoxin family protein n=1 Tax=Rudaea sp. TaxID=2136325 RepID=UPI002F940B34
MKHASVLASVLCCILLPLAGASASEAPQSIDAALQRAQAAHLPVLIDFQAQWCYSCYFMATHVLTGPQWDAIEKRIVFIETDADSPDGARWMEKLGVKALPSYVVLDGNGVEMGRILAEQPRAKFYPALERILGGGDKLDSLKAQATKGSTTALADALASYHARNQVQAGLDWYATLPPARLKAAEADGQAATWHARLQMEKAAKDKNTAQCVAAAQHALAGDVGCDRYYVLDTLLQCSEKLPDAERKSLLAAQRPALNALLDSQVFVASPTCVDQRSAVFVSADLNKAIGNTTVEQAVLARGIAAAQQAIGGDFRKDRNAADNLRVYLLRAGRTTDVDALMPNLIAAYPDDYVYAYRYGRSLLDRGKAAEALPYLEQASAKAFGVNRLGVASLRVKALIALNRRSDAEKVVADALEANGPWFPEAAAKLKATLKS